MPKRTKTGQAKHDKAVLRSAGWYKKGEYSVKTDSGQQKRNNQGTKKIEKGVVTPVPSYKPNKPKPKPKKKFN